MVRCPAIGLTTIHPAEADDGNVVVLAAAGCEFLNNRDQSLPQPPGGIGSSLQGGKDALRLELRVVDVHSLGDAVSECEQAIARLQMDLARTVFETVHDPDRQ